MEDNSPNSMSDDRSSRSASSRPKVSTAKWGAACGPCATAKAKCIRSNDVTGSKCDRCERLYKNCSDQVHRPRKKRQVKPSRTTQIEERLNGLVTLLKASGGLSSTEQAAYAAANTTAELDPNLFDQKTPSASSPSSFQPGQSSWAVPHTYNSHAPPTCICRLEGGEIPPPPESDEVLLTIYRSELQAVHPFVIVPAHVSAAALKSTRPFLLSAIKMVASYRNLKSMRAQKYHLMKHLADQMLIRSEKSLDLLLGIIVITGWYQYHCFVHAQLSNLLACAVALIGDLGLNRHPSVNGRSVLMMVKPYTPAARTNEERRALAGVWFLTSSMSINFYRIESMRYTNYLQECLKELEVAKEYKTDVTLFHLVRIQHLTERIYHLNCKDQAMEEVSGLPTAPVSAYISAYQGELDRIRESLPEHLSSDNLFMSYFHTAMLRLYQPPVIDSDIVNSMSNALTSNTPGAASPLDQLYRLRNTLVAWFDNWLSVPASLYYRQSTPVAAQVVYALTMLGRWARLATPNPLLEGTTSTTPDLSTNDPNMSLYESISPDADDPSPYSVPSPLIKIIDTGEMCSYGQIVLRHGIDQRLPAAVAVLRSKLQQQPGLSIEISHILSTLTSRFEEADAIFNNTSSEDPPGRNIWSIGAMKMRITRVKLERWADLVSQGIQAMNLDERNAGDENIGENRGLDAAGRAPMDGLVDYGQSHIPLDHLPMQNVNGSSPWTNDLLQGVDPSVWFDGYLDWSTVIMNPMGTVD